MSVRNILIRLARSNTLKLLAAGAALVSGIDDLVELYFGVQDIFGMDAAHGVVTMALTGILDPLAKLIGESDREIRKMEQEQREK